MAPYDRRTVDDELDELLPDLAALAIEGPKGVGKTATATQRAASIIRLDEAAERALLIADPARLTRLTPPVLVDEWQRLPEVWDRVRRSVDDNPTGGRFLLTGSATPTERPTHSGAGRIVRVRMRPMSLAERSLAVPTVSLREMLAGEVPTIEGESPIDLPGYVEEILASGYPGIRGLGQRARTAQLDSYLARIVDAEFSDLGHRIRRPTLLRNWMAAYAAATSTTTSYNGILDAATPGESDKPSQSATSAYRDVLTQLWVLDPVPGWAPATNQLGRLAEAPKHQLADPALAARLLGVSAEGLLMNRVPVSLAPPDGTLLGSFFEALVTLSVRVYAQAIQANVLHLRRRNGDHEVDLIVESPDRQIVGLEVKLNPTPTDRDVAHLKWLRHNLGDQVADLAVITTGRHAYRRPDGIAVIPAALLGP